MACKLVVAVALLGCVCLASAQVDPQTAPKRQFGLVNGLYEVTGGNPNAVGIGGYSAIMETKGGKEINAAAALLNPPLLGAPAGTLVGPATPFTAEGEWVDMTYNQFPTWRLTVRRADGTVAATTHLVQVSENLLLTYPVGTVIPNPPTAATATTSLARVGQVLSVKGDKFADMKDGKLDHTPKNHTKVDSPKADKPDHTPKNSTKVDTPKADKPDHTPKNHTKVDSPKADKPDRTPKDNPKVDAPKAPKNTTKNGKN